MPKHAAPSGRGQAERGETSRDARGSIVSLLRTDRDETALGSLQCRRADRVAGQYSTREKAVTELQR